MDVLGVDKVLFGVEDLEKCKQFFVDWGLSPQQEGPDRLDFETLNRCQIQIRPAASNLPLTIEAGSTVRELTWGVETKDDLNQIRARLTQDAPDAFCEDANSGSCTDPNGFRTRFEISKRRAVEAKGVPANIYGAPPQRINKASPIYQRAEPIDIGHVVFFTQKLSEVEAFYVSVCPVSC